MAYTVPNHLKDRVREISYDDCGVPVKAILVNEKTCFSHPDDYESVSPGLGQKMWRFMLMEAENPGSVEKIFSAIVPKTPQSVRVPANLKYRM